MFEKSKNIPKILENYLNYLIVVRGYSINTVKAYCSDLMQFFSFIKKFKEIPVLVYDFNVFILLQIKETDITAFLVYLNYNRDNSPYTRQRKLNTIRKFFKWLLSKYPNENAIKNPALNIDSVKKLERIPKHLSLEQAKKIQNIFNPRNSRFHIRNNAIISLFLSAGIRVSELISINYGDINFNENSIIIFGKNKKERQVYFNNYCKNKLLEYISLRKRNEQNFTQNSPLFINKFGKRIGIDAVEDICSKAYSLIGIGDFGYSPHTLRHTAATIIYTYINDDVLLLKEFLGHSHVSTTQIYTHVSSQRVKDAVNKHPLNDYKISKFAKIA